MSDAKQWSWKWTDYEEGKMTETPDGEYVLASDYEALKVERDALKAERDALRSMLDPTQVEWHDKPPLKIARYVVAPPATGINGPSTAYVNWLEMQLFKAREVKP